MRLLELADAAGGDPGEGGSRGRVEVPLKPDLHESILAAAKLYAEVGGLRNRVGERFLDEYRRAAAGEGQTVARVVLGA